MQANRPSRSPSSRGVATQKSSPSRGGTKVGEAAEEVDDAYGYDPDDPTFVHPDEGELDRNKPLARYHLDGNTVNLVNEEQGV